jgi:UDP-N-acetylmuramate dehydrogenase
VTLENVARSLRKDFSGRVETVFPLGRLTTYRLGGPAALYVEPSSAADLEVLGRELQAHEEGDVPVLPLGRGSNLVVSDQGFDGVVIRMGDAFSWMKEWGESGLDAGASTSLPLLSNWAARRSLSGLEFAVAIPGSVGGAIRMNAGAHGSDVSERLDSVTVFDLTRLALDERRASELGFSYRSSALGSADLVVSARWGLMSAPEKDIRAKMESYRKHRAETQPGAVQNAGSVFKNPPGDSAGRLVEAAGLKGWRVGGAAVSELHANFFVAEPGATAQEVFDLVTAVKRRVHEAFGVTLEEEIRFVGAFHSEDKRDEDHQRDPS